MFSNKLGIIDYLPRLRYRYCEKAWRTSFLNHFLSLHYCIRGTSSFFVFCAKTSGKTKPHSHNLFFCNSNPVFVKLGTNTFLKIPKWYNRDAIKIVLYAFLGFFVILGNLIFNFSDCFV